MDRAQILTWLHEHPDAVHGDADALVERCEVEVKRHAREDAWLSAKAYAERKAHAWKESWGFHASDEYVAREACLHMSRALRTHEPHFKHGDEEHLAGESNLSAFESDGRERLEEYVLELAESEKHRIWREIVRFTKHEAKLLARSGAYSNDLHDWEANSNYMTRAALIAQLLADEFEAHSRES